jgi:hypothetical protein
LSLDVDVLNAVIGPVPMERGLELVAPIRTHGVNPERERRDHVIEKRNRVRLGVASVDAQGPDTRRVVDRRVLVATRRHGVRAAQREERDIDLHVMAWDLFGVPVGVHRAPAHACRKPVHAMTSLAPPCHLGRLRPGIPIPRSRCALPARRWCGRVDQATVLVYSLAICTVKLDHTENV